MSPRETFFKRLSSEVGASLYLAVPVILGQSFSVAMNVVDTLLAGRHSALTLAAVGVGSAVWSLVLLILIGLLMVVPPFVAQLNGAGRRAEIGPLFRQALWLAGSLGVVLLLLLRQAEVLLAGFGIDPEVRPEALRFLSGLGWGAPALALYFCSRNLSEGLSWTVPTMLFGLCGLIVLIPLGYGLLFGAFGLPALGAYGLGLATALVQWAQALGFLTYLAVSGRFSDLGLFARFDRPDPATLKELLRVGVPMAVMIFMEGSLFVASALVIGRMGAVEVAAHQIAINVTSLAFMVPLGVAIATTVRVGHAAGAGRMDALRWAAGAGLAIVLATQVLILTAMLFGAQHIAGLYTDDLAVAGLAATLLLYAAAFQVPDGLQALAGGALRGIKDTRIPMLYTAVAYWGLGMPLGALLGLGLGWGPQGLWAGLILGLTAAAALLGGRFLRRVGAHASGA
ncbi:MAG TPA: MATE family efflux transporter [Xanthomonadales bacterium]|nr:MATE family efflux transporter [Xanthomonadales bacterium]